ncbi:DUF4040 domain-containing protein [Flexistipes sp.]|uniref:DUF4040 domain-containing protein n=1 Tax=Flexistipes sp. TaxID=3088135 RepID=UPI002E23C56E|nr:DUF4040 domain-containing protein [Flexistipes sp.]
MIAVDFLLLLLLVIIAIAAISAKDILTSIMLLGSYSLVIAMEWMLLNAVDVAFTEAAVGAGISTILMIAVLTRVPRFEKELTEQKHFFNLFNRSELLALATVVITGVLLISGTWDMPAFGDPNSPANSYLSPEYIERSYPQTGSHNIVTAVLASYRGYDTLGETTVVFTAAVCLVLLIRSYKNNER